MALHNLQVGSATPCLLRTHVHIRVQTAVSSCMCGFRGIVGIVVLIAAGSNGLLLD